MNSKKGGEGRGIALNMGNKWERIKLDKRKVPLKTVSYKLSVVSKYHCSKCEQR